MRKYVTPIVEIFRKHPCGLWVSNFGRVWWTSRKYPNGHFTYGSDSGKGYLRVGYQGKLYQVHRLVAECFLENPDNKPEVDHIDRNPKNNRVENLRFVTHSENQKNKGKYTIPNAKLNNGHSKIVLQFTKAGEFVREWPSVNEVERQLGFSHSNISNCCSGKRKSAYKYIWKYKEEDD